MKEITTKSNDIVYVDDEIYDYLSQFVWYTRKDRKTKYAIRFDTINGKKTSIQMHRDIMKLTDTRLIDHIDGNRLNNQKDNLRICNNSENHMNRGKQRNNTSGYKGVTWHKKDKKWQAQIIKERKCYYLGSFVDPEDAARAYDKKAKELHGQFAKLNFSEDS